MACWNAESRMERYIYAHSCSERGYGLRLSGLLLIFDLELNLFGLIRTEQYYTSEYLDFVEEKFTVVYFKYSIVTDSLKIC